MDFVLVMLILVPLFAAIVQVGLTLYVRNTVAACAQEGARYGANADFVEQGTDFSEAVQRATSCIDDSLSPSYSGDVNAAPGNDADSAGAAVDVVEVTVKAPVPVLGMWALGGNTLTVKGDAMQEQAQP